MIDNLRDYKYVGARRANDDIYSIRVNGQIMPRRSGLSVDILRGEDIIFLQEAAIERHNYWQRVSVGDYDYYYVSNPNYISDDRYQKPAYFEKKVSKSQEGRVYQYVADLYDKKICLKEIPQATILTGDVPLINWLSSCVLTTADMDSSYDYSDYVLRRSSLSNMFEDVKKIQYTYMDVGNNVRWNNISAYDRQQGNQMSVVVPPSLHNNEMQYRSGNFWSGSQQEGVTDTFSYDWCSVADYSSGGGLTPVYGDVIPYSDSSPRVLYGWRCVGRWGYMINSRGVPEPGVVHTKTAFLTNLDVSFRPTRGIFDLIMQEYFQIDPVHMPYYEVGSKPKDTDPVGQWYYSLRIYPFVIFPINQQHTKWW